MDIRLISASKLPKTVMVDWFVCVKKFAPSGTVTTSQKKVGSGYKDVAMVRRQTEDGFEYIVELTRNLSEKEVEEIIEQFDFNGDYKVEATSDSDDALELHGDNYNDICAAIAKNRHETWCRDRAKDGWRFGQTMSLLNKTSPLMKPWHELSDEYKKIDYNEPQILISLLADNGYYVVSKQELEGIKALLRK